MLNKHEDILDRQCRTQNKKKLDQSQHPLSFLIQERWSSHCRQKSGCCHHQPVLFQTLQIPDQHHMSIDNRIVLLMHMDYYVTVHTHA